MALTAFLAAHGASLATKPLGDPAFQGEHNRAVCIELGLTESEIERCIASGALVSVALPDASLTRQTELA